MKLNPCPICGEEPVSREVVEGKVWSVTCSDVLHHVSITNWTSAEDAGHQWNQSGSWGMQ